MQSSATNTVTIPSVKAPRPKVGNEPLNPSGREMRKHEREMGERLERALADWQRRIFRGVTDDTAVLLIQRIDRRDVWQPMQEALEAELLRVASAGVEHAASVFNRVVLGVKSSGDIFGVLWDLANVDAARWARQYSFLLIRDLVDSRRRYLQQEIAAFADNSQTINQLGQRLSRFFNADRAKTIAITETTRAFARGNMAAWQQQDIIKQHRWNTANDELVCPICGPLNDQTTKIGAPFPNSALDSPPAHPRCRCWLTPVVELGVEEAIVEPELTPQETMERAVQQALTAVEDEIRTLPHEEAAIVDNFGEVLLRKRGTEAFVEFTDDEIDLMSGLTLTHNHPSGRSFSFADMAMTHESMAKEIRAVGRRYDGRSVNYRFVVDDSSFYDFTREDLGYIDDMAGAAAGKVVDPKYFNNELTRDEANWEVAHLRLEKFTERVNQYAGKAAVRYIMELLD